MEEIIMQMKSLGLTEYEVKAYLTLLKEYPINGYALSKSSGIPRSRIYEVLNGLKRKQIVFEQESNNKTIYSPLEPSLLLKKLKKDFESVIESVGEYTTNLYNSKENDFEPKVIRGRDEILKMIKVLLKDANKRVVLSIWDEELLDLKTEVDGIVESGVILRGMYFGYDNPYEDLVTHRRMKRYIAEKDERFIIVVIDDKYVVSGVVSRGEESQATWSVDPHVVEISDDFVAHDVALNTYNNYLEGEERYKYERITDEVRKNYFGYTDEEYYNFPDPEMDED